MTEKEWLTCEDPQTMLAFVQSSASVRCFWLFGVAAARQVWGRLRSGCKTNVELVERYADGNATSDEAQQIQHALPIGKTVHGGIYLTSNPIEFARHCAGICQIHSAWSALERDDSIGYRQCVAIHASAQTILVRDIFGNPFRPIAFAPEWSTDTVLAIAAQMYESRDFAAMPILADALQDAGCDNADILNHCRDTAQTHVRGCWVVDLVRGES